MTRKEIKAVLDSTTEKDLPYIFVPSYKRPNFVAAQKLFREFTPEALERVFIVVREEQLKAYRKQNPWLQFIPIPRGTVDGVGSTRQFILDYATQNKLPCAMDMDDDIKCVEYLFSGLTVKGEPCSTHTNLKDREREPEIPQQVLQLAGRIARSVFKRHPEVLLGSLRKQRFSNHPEMCRTQYQINKGPTPRQTKILNVKGIHRAGIRMPEEFNLHGDDIGFAAEVLQRGYSCFNIPCLTYDYIDDQVDSVVRDPHDQEANRWLHELEYNALQEMEIRRYLRETHKFPDGQYKFGDIDWRKYHKLHGTNPIVKEW